MVHMLKTERVNGTKRIVACVYAKTKAFLVDPSRFKEFRRWRILRIFEEFLRLHANFHRPVNLDTELRLFGDDARFTEVDAAKQTDKKSESLNTNPPGKAHPQHTL
jgi:hypothetical protein